MVPSEWEAQRVGCPVVGSPNEREVQIQQAGGTELPKSLGLPFLGIRGIILSAARQCSFLLFQQEILTPFIS